jgi:hypothetical protein
VSFFARNEFFGGRAKLNAPRNGMIILRESLQTPALSKALIHAILSGLTWLRTRRMIRIETTRTSAQAAAASVPEVANPELARRLARSPLLRQVQEALQFDGQHTSLRSGLEARKAIPFLRNEHLLALRKLVELGCPLASGVTHIDLRWSGVSTLKDLSVCEKLMYLDTRACQVRSLAPLGAAAKGIRVLLSGESCKSAEELKPFTALVEFQDCYGKFTGLEAFRGHKTLEQVDISGRQGDSAYKPAGTWEVLSTIPNLRRILITNCSGLTAEIIGQLKALEEVDIENQELDGDVLLPSLLGLSKLSRISLNGVVGKDRYSSLQPVLQEYANSRPAVTIWLDGKKISAQVPA